LLGVIFKASQITLPGLHEISGSFFVREKNNPLLNNCSVNSFSVNRDTGDVVFGISGSRDALPGYKLVNTLAQLSG
jgi:hypothetical protein